MVAPLKISARVEIDSAQAKQGAAVAASAVDTIGAAAERNTTKVQALINASVGIGGGAANRNIREWTGALAMQGKSLDELRAKYNPLFATISQYKAAQMEIRTLHAQGVLSTNEMTAAIQRQRQATLASIDAIKGRNSLMRGGRDAEAGFRRQNLGYQVFDIGQGLSSGMPMGMITAQQLPQIAQIYAGQGGGIKALLADIGSLARGAVTAVGAMPLAIGVAGAAAILYDKNVSSAAAKAERALEKHEQALERIKALFDQSGSGAERYGQRVQSAISFAERSDRKALEDALAGQTQAAGRELLNAVPRSSGAAMNNLYGPYLAAVQKFIAEARQGRGDIAAFNDEVNRIANANQADERVQRIGQRLLETTKAASDTASKIKELNDEFARTSMLTARTDAALTMTKYRIENADALTAIRRMNEAELGGIGARSPNELADAARARVRAEPVNPQESVQVRTARENAAATLARAQAERSLLDAAEQRNRQLDNSLASQQLELSLIGQAIGERERLRMQFRLESELRAEAARNNVRADEAELERVKALSAEYGRLAEQIVAKNALDEQDRELASLRVRQALLGQSEEVRAKAIGQLQTEQRLREMGISLGSREADQYRQKAELIAKQNAEIGKQEVAWDKVRGTAESSIDTIFDKFSEGDFGGALEDVAKDWSKTILQLGGANPMKNGLLGTNHETLDDIGGIGGMVSKLFGGGMSTGAMSVTAATVNVNGGIAAGVPSLLGNPANDNVASALPTSAGSALSFVGNYKRGVDARLTDILDTAAQKFPGYKVDAMSGFRPGDPRFHGKGLATDVQLTDLVSGKLLGNYQDAASFSTYERFAQTARAVQMAKYPELADKFRWGGYFGGGKGKYGALDTMHFDLGGAGMAGGSWDAGLNAKQAALWPGIESKGNAAVAALDKLAGQSNVAASGLGTLGAGMDKFGSALTNAGAGGGNQGGGGFLSSIFGMLFSPQYRIASSGGVGLYAKGGIADRPSIFAEAGAEAAVPLPDGRTIPVTLNVRQSNRNAGQGGGMPSSGSNVSIHIQNYSGADIRQEETTDSRGNRQVTMVVGEQGAAAVKQRGNPLRKAIQSDFSVRPRGVAR